ncbi:DUF2130 domain-containing protein [Sulfuricurvum sp.]|uniref:DUF2130 domain-containing protein n=1 Tax=Sulfuricurvum sp. TaxID=2025608 RepID=UPI0035664E6B
MSNQTTIQCPKCGTQIDVNEILYHQLEAQMKSKFDGEVDEHRKKYKAAMDEFKAKEEAFKDQQEKFDEKLRDSVSTQLKAERQKLSDALKKQILDEQSESMALLQKELAEKSEQVKELNRSKAEIEQLKRAITEAEEVAKLKAEQVLTERLKEEKEKIHKLVDEQNELKLKEKDKQLEDQKKLIEEMKRKAEQGSMQLQGEVQELAIEEWLMAQYPFDSIEEIKKGQRGGDCIQSVHTREMQNCGTIYYESKRTKDFQSTWIEKFKADMRDRGADIGVLVTSTMPKDMDRMGLLDGVWVCTYEEFKGLSMVLRENVIRMARALLSEENKTDKMTMLYSFLTSNEFKMQIEAIVEGFSQMQADLDSERRAMQRIWKQREKQINKVLENTTGMYGSIQGIAGNAIGSIKALELPYSGEDEED